MKRLYKLYYGPKGTRIYYDDDGQEYETDDSGAEYIMVNDDGSYYHCNEDGTEYNPCPGPKPKVVSSKLILHADTTTVVNKMKRLCKLYYGPKKSLYYYDSDGLPQEYMSYDDGTEYVMVDESTGAIYECDANGNEFLDPTPEPKVASSKLMLFADKETCKVDIGTIDTYNDGYIKLNTGPRIFDKKELISLLFNG